MNLTSLIAHIHWLPVVIMTVFSFALGALWHTQFLFGKIWTVENKVDAAELKSQTPLIFGGAAVMHFVTLAGLSAVVAGTGMVKGLETGLFISLVWILPAMAGTYLFAGRSLRLLAIDAGMYIVLFSISGLVLGLF